MRPMRWISVALLPLAIGVAGAQEKGQGKGQGGDDKGKKDVVKAERQSQRRDVSRASLQRPDDDNRARGRLQRLDDDNRGRGRLQRLDDNRGRGNARDDDKDKRIVVESHGSLAPAFRNFTVSELRGRRVVGLAVARAVRRGIAEDAFVITPVADRVQVLNRDGIVLVDFPEDREMGNWTVVTTPFRDRRGAPSFCRSGAGHPVWGRQWCIDKGFGLGEDGDLRWARVIDPGDVIITRPTTSDLTRDVLVGVLGSIVLNRLATHAVTLGLQDPLTGRWLGEPLDTGPRVLLVSSGARPIAEVVDVNRDGRADVLAVAVRLK